MNRARCVVALVTVVTFLLISVAAVAAAKPKPKPRVVLGTKQLGGEDNAKIGVTYTLGKRDPINVTLNSVDYSVEPIYYDKNMLVPNVDQKFMILRYTLHNPNPRDRGLGWSTNEIFAVDMDNTNWRFACSVGMKDSGKQCNMKLKPGQKTEVYTHIQVPAKGEIPKIVFQSPDKLVLRYQVAGKVKPLPAPVVDPADPTGATPLEKVPAQIGTYYNLKYLTVKLDSIAFTTDKVKDRLAPKGKRYLVIAGSIKNTTIIPQGIAWSTVKAKLTDADGGEIRWNGNLLYASRDDSLNAKLEPGQEIRFRWFFEVPEAAGLQSLSVSQSGGRDFVYDVSSVK